MVHESCVYGERKLESGSCQKAESERVEVVQAAAEAGATRSTRTGRARGRGRQMCRY